MRQQQIQRRRQRPADDYTPDDLPEVKPSKASELAAQWLARTERES